uniref:Uncharacterized protein n=1 Tax=Peronospora matthiolae TaxID=2874970 RepID=A0AAV1TMV7_9STRA
MEDSSSDDLSSYSSIEESDLRRINSMAIKQQIDTGAKAPEGRPIWEADHHRHTKVTKDLARRRPVKTRSALLWIS